MYLQQTICSLKADCWIWLAQQSHRLAPLHAARMQAARCARFERRHDKHHGCPCCCCCFCCAAGGCNSPPNHHHCTAKPISLSKPSAGAQPFTTATAITQVQARVSFVRLFVVVLSHIYTSNVCSSCASSTLLLSAACQGTATSVLATCTGKCVVCLLHVSTGHHLAG